MAGMNAVLKMAVASLQHNPSTHQSEFFANVCF